MVELNLKALLLLLARLVLAWVFISAALPKLQEPAAFAASVEGFRIISGSCALWVAVLLPWLELVIGFGLLTPWLRRASAFTMAFLLGLFIGLHASAWARGLDITCGCFGASATTPDYHWLILRNTALMLVAIFVLCDSLRNKKTPRSTT